MKNARRVKVVSQNINISPDVCYIGFLRKGELTRCDHSKECFETIRGELMIFDFDRNNKVVGIELVEPNKSCQKV